LPFKMNDQAFTTLEFGSLRALVRRDAQTEMGRARVDGLAPIDNPDQLQRALRAVAEGLELRRRGARLSFDGVADPSELISRLKIEGTALDALAILDLARLCQRAIEARTAILAARDACPTLFEMVAALPRELSDLAAAVGKKILPDGELDDRASPELAHIRRDITRVRSQITRSLEKLMRRSSEAIQEELVTQRNDRFVIPVRADHRGRINGVAHGSSSSGATIFVEPIETIEANNELQSLREAEQREIAEILFALSEELRRQLPALAQAANAVAELDFIGAKAAFAEKFDCVVPVIAGSAGVPPALSAGGANESAIADSASNGKTLEFIDARHPLLEENLRDSGDKVVPVSFKLDERDTTMVISGANAGGKTVALKTAGLLSLMALSGLPVSARAARVPFYRSILADIGDHQSLAANLSTFTSHVANIASMIEWCEAPALVLLDEVGTGTDPEEGSALGVAVVDHFKRRGAQVLATTHYPGLKMYAANEPGVLNASVEFDDRTLRPTYRLLVGIAGSSSGLEIAARFGIPGEVISQATEQVQKSSRDVVEYLRRIKREAEEAEALRRALEEERAAVAETFASLDKRARKREDERQAGFARELVRTIAEFEKHSRELLAKIEDRAVRARVGREAGTRAAELKREAHRIQQESRERGQVALFQRNGTQSQGQEGDLPPQLREAKTEAESMRDERATPAGGRDVRAHSARERNVKVGDRVRLLSLGSIGIVDQIKDNEAEVRVGSLRMREKLSNLESIEAAARYRTARASERVKPERERAKSDESTSAAPRLQAQPTEVHLHSSGETIVRTELNLIGKTTDEAVALADKFLDDAFLNGLSEVRIIHGHGTGALRRAIAELLEDHPHVAHFAPAPSNHGGAGATVVALNQ
jgi:DNA mismatch repair protein MutS2